MKPTHSEIDSVLKTLLKTQGSNTMLGRMGEKYEPFKVLISTILSARAKDEVTEVIAEQLFKRYPTAHALARAKQKDVAKIIHRIGFYNAKSKNVINTAKMLVEKYNSKVPRTMEQLLEFPGVGRKVANCVLVYAYHKDAIPVDVHVHQIANRLGWVKTKTPEQTETTLERLVPRKHWQRINDTFVTHGKTVCVSVSPFCSKCPIFGHCKRVGVTRRR
jgi:endonuclease-3